MTGKRSAYATSEVVAPTRQMDFPYSDVKAWLGVGCDGESEWAFVGFKGGVNLADTESRDGFNVINTRIRWDAAVSEVRLTQKWGANFLHFADKRQVIAKVSSASSVLLELEWHGQRPTFFEFPLRGSSEALREMRGRCSGR